MVIKRCVCGEEPYMGNLNNELAIGYGKTLNPYYVYCNNCSIVVGYSETYQKAIRSWNNKIRQIEGKRNNKDQ